MFRLIATILLLSLCFAGSPRAEVPLCGTRTAIGESLEKEHDESPVARGLGVGNTMVEIFTNPKTKTWTFLITSPDGNSCMLGHGKAWHTLTPPVKKMGLKI